MLVIGIFPNLILYPTAAAVDDLLHRAEERRVVPQSSVSWTGMDESTVQAWFDDLNEPNIVAHHEWLDGSH